MSSFDAVVLHISCRDVREARERLYSWGFSALAFIKLVDKG